WGIALFLVRGVYFVLFASAAGACAVVPDIPPDFALPVRAIIAQTACELKDALTVLDRTPEYQGFKARKWLVTISLLPKATADLNGSGGFTRKSLNNPLRITTWSMTGPGAQLDDKGIRSSGINYNVKSGDLILDKTLQCPPDDPSVHVLAQHLGVGEWLYRSADAKRVASSLTVDKPTYNSEITITFSANGSYSFAFPPGTNLAAFGGSYSLDEQLNISMAPITDTPPLKVTTLPSSSNYPQAVVSVVETEPAQLRLDLQGIETALRKLQSQ
ncbi:MAG: hypothetical protein JSS54_18740, partial [Proteobacteria bacterium]|nr:hypothetical protein [Pseudomonadota bacterium]